MWQIKPNVQNNRQNKIKEIARYERPYPPNTFPLNDTTLLQHIDNIENSNTATSNIRTIENEIKIFELSIKSMYIDNTTKRWWWSRAPLTVWPSYHAKIFIIYNTLSMNEGTQQYRIQMHTLPSTAIGCEQRQPGRGVGRAWKFHIKMEIATQQHAWTDGKNSVICTTSDTASSLYANHTLTLRFVNRNYT